MVSGRGGGGDRRPRIKPVKQIEVSNKHLTLRFVGFGVCLIIAVVSLWYGLSQLVSTEPGWQEIQVSASDMHCGSEFTLSYYFTESDGAGDKRRVTKVYSDAAVSGYRLFHGTEVFDGVVNPAYISAHPGETLTVDEALYSAFSTLEAAGNRLLYLGPVYEQYDGLFVCTEDWETVNYDPYTNPEIAAYYQSIADFAKNPNSIRLELLGNNQVRLTVSDDYRKFAEENEIVRLLDFSWMKNAFLADYLADKLCDAGFSGGYLASFDGFYRSLSLEQSDFQFRLYDDLGDRQTIVASLQLTGKKAMIYLRAFPIGNAENSGYYRLKNGEIRTPYVDITDGRCRAAAQGMLSYSSGMGCAQMLMQMIPVYVADSCEEEALRTMRQSGIDTVLVQTGKITATEQGLAIETYDDGQLSYKLSILP